MTEQSRESTKIQSTDSLIPEPWKSTLSYFGVKELYPPQRAALQSGVLDGSNLVLASPTASGKTLVSELAIFKRLTKTGGKALYIVPLRALASEKNYEFRRLFSASGFRVAISTGDLDSPDQWLASYDIIIATVEKVDSLIRHGTPWLRTVSIVVADEIHLLNDVKRGPTLEVVLARLRQIRHDVQIVALSATIKNADEIAKWLNAKLVTSNFRPVPLKEGVFLRGQNDIKFNNGETHQVGGEHHQSNDDHSSPVVGPVNGNGISSLVSETIRSGGQLLVFRSTRSGVVAEARRLVEAVTPLLAPEELTSLRVAAAYILRTGELTRVTQELAKDIESGVAYHHAGLSSSHRRLIEEYFKKNIVKVICCTPTLASGVNLPARRVVIEEYRRHSMLGPQPIPVLEYKQMAGRAGRPKYDASGEAVLVANSESERDDLISIYCKGETERIYSKIGNRSTLRTHVLSTIATTPILRSGMTTLHSSASVSLEEISQFLSNTFYSAQQNNANELLATVEDILSELTGIGMISETTQQRSNSRRTWCVTELGRRVAELCIDPLSASTIVKGLTQASAQGDSVSEVGLIHLMSSTQDMPSSYLSRADYPLMRTFADSHITEFLLPIPADAVDYEDFLAKCKTTAIIRHWVEEASEDNIIETFDVGSGDLARIAEQCDWLLYSSYELYKLIADLSSPISVEILGKLWLLRQRISKGVQEELLELTSLKGVGRLRARMLYQAGFTTQEKLRKEGTFEKLRAVPTIGERTATLLIEQLHPS